MGPEQWSLLLLVRDVSARLELEPTAMRRPWRCWVARLFTLRFTLLPWLSLAHRRWVRRKGLCGLGGCYLSVPAVYS